MDPTQRSNLEATAAVLEAQIKLYQTKIKLHDYQSRGRRKALRKCWSRAWLGPQRRRQFGLYDQLMVELRREDPKSFINFMRMPPEMFDEILQRVGPRITKQYTFFRAPLEPGLKLAITLRHLASGSKYSNMRFGWRVPHNTISIIVREVNIYNYIYMIFFSG